jgi:hypothetical protein
MSAPPLDRSFLTDGRPYLNAWQAAMYIGCDITTATRDDRALQTFYEWARRNRVPKMHRGRCLLFRRVDLDRAVGEPQARHSEAQHDTLQQAALRLARGERR